MPSFQTYNKSSIDSYISNRDGETKLGEQLIFPNLKDFEGEYVIVGISEDIGPVANHGKPGAKNAWKAFLSSFLNIQYNGFIDPNQFMILGEVNIDDLYPIENDNTEALNKKVEQIDEIVFNIISSIKSANKTPIIIGGGHNNAFPIIKACANKESINVLNIDPHADIRPLEGRHSGNGFSYALNKEYLKKYFVLGLHEGYNSNFILNQFQLNDDLSYITYEDIIRHDITLAELIKASYRFLDAKSIGLEIDLDSIANMPVSAKTPSGFDLNFIRKLIYKLSAKVNFEYIHVCEGAPTTNDENITVGKAISYIVQDIIKA